MSRYVRQEKSLRKHPVASSATSLLKAPVVPTSIKERPSWKGPGFVKKASKKPSPSAPSTSKASVIQVQQHLLSSDLQQLLLNVFRSTFPACQDYDALKPTLQQLNDALSKRDFVRAFGNVEWLEAYAVRWSPSRALCYATVLVEICEEFGEEFCLKKLLTGEEDMKSSPTAVCFGGGAAEVMAFAALVRHSRLPVDGQSSSPDESGNLSRDMNSMSLGSPSSATTLKLRLIDEADWAPVISSLKSGLETPPVLSKYASASAKANNSPFIIREELEVSNLQCNILEMGQDELKSGMGTDPLLITMFLTLNDILVTSVAKTTAFLLKLTLATPKHSLLLIIDTPDVSSEVLIENDDQGNEKKKYPVGYLLDMVLMEKFLPKEQVQNPAWERLVGDELRSFVSDDTLKFPLLRENIKFQVHLFKKL